ncbi:hypothetical protein CK203_112562 [Vitis vinifera]|uniref:MULE transposase domain-containing protein n=1 Tax=Vitis vinifera TaxID=29760 RepID=A0A438DJE1_VITVI|nr:hypothetical protein CK203_112562 [Vitis vinifera]
MKAKRKAMTRLFGDWYKSYVELPRFFLALEQSNPGCIMYSKMVPETIRMKKFFSVFFRHSLHLFKGFAHYRPVLSIDGTHLYGKYKGTLLIAMGCDAVVNETYSGWTQPDACHRFCMHHLASNFNTKFKDKTLKDLMCRAAMETEIWIMTTNMSEVFNGVLKGARNLPITALVQLTFYRVNSYFTVRREHGASDSSLAAEVAMAPFDSGSIPGNGAI